MNATATANEFACKFASRYESFFYGDYETATAHFEAALDTITAGGNGVVHWFVAGEENRDIRRAYEVCEIGGRLVSITASLNGKYAVCLTNLDAR